MMRLELDLVVRWRGRAWTVDGICYAPDGQPVAIWLQSGVRFVRFPLEDLDRLS
jgi:hypothetical protein